MERSFLVKVMRAFNKKNAKITELKYKVKSLEKVMKRFRSKKRVKVKTNPNKQFTRLPKVQRAIQKT